MAARTVPTGWTRAERANAIDEVGAFSVRTGDGPNRAADPVTRARDVDGDVAFVHGRCEHGPAAPQERGDEPGESSFEVTDFGAVGQDRHGGSIDRVV
jgi:hypothetical protein